MNGDCVNNQCECYTDFYGESCALQITNNCFQYTSGEAQSPFLCSVVDVDVCDFVRLLSRIKSLLHARYTTTCTPTHLHSPLIPLSLSLCDSSLSLPVVVVQKRSNWGSQY